MRGSTLIISDKYRFIFIHINKCAGTSIRHALSRYSLSFRDRASDWLYRNFGLTRPYHAIYSPHITANELRTQIGHEIFDSYFSFSICRNPWALQVSLFTYMRTNKNHWQYDFAWSFKTFDDYCRWRCDGNFQTQRECVCSPSGELLVDYLGRFERVEEDFKYICERVGLGHIHLPKKNVSNTEPYQTFYSDFSRDLIADTFAEDIKFLNYRFDT